MTLTYTDFDLDTDQDGIVDVDEDSLAPFFYDKDGWVKAHSGEVKQDANTVTLEVNHLSVYDIGIDRRTLPSDFALYFTRNPFRLDDGTTIVFAAPGSGRLTVKIYDLAGDLVAIVVDNLNIPGEGEYSLRWNGLSQFDRFQGSGIYVYIAYFRGDGAAEPIVIRKPIGVIK
jgi:hypothetical protein